MSTQRRVQDRSSRLRKRRFCLTLNNPTALDCVKWNTVVLEGCLAEGASKLTYFVVQSERGDEGTFHYQAYAEFKTGVGWTTLKAIFGDRVHIIDSRGSPSANIIYCTKPDSRVTGENLCVSGQWGTPKRGGGVTAAAIKVLNGASLAEIVSDHPGIAMMSMGKIESLIAYAKGPRTERPKVIVLYGLTGCGKSQYCMRTYGTSAHWVSSPVNGRVWWGGYVAQDVCILDDFHSGWFSLTWLIRMFDSTPFVVEPKGGEVPFNSGTIVVTCNVDPRDWYLAYKGKPAHKDALERRIQDFAEIYDCTRGPAVPLGVSSMIKVVRTETFKFRRGGGLDFSVPAGNGDTTGNGFMF